MCGQVRTGADNSGSWVSLLVGGHLADRCGHLADMWTLGGQMLHFWTSMERDAIVSIKRQILLPHNHRAENAYHDKIVMTICHIFWYIFLNNLDDNLDDILDDTMFYGCEC